MFHLICYLREPWWWCEHFYTGNNERCGKWIIIKSMFQKKKNENYETQNIKQPKFKDWIKLEEISMENGAREIKTFYDEQMVVCRCYASGEWQLQQFCFALLFFLWQLRLFASFCFVLFMFHQWSLIIDHIKKIKFMYTNISNISKRSNINCNKWLTAKPVSCGIFY